MLPTPTPYDLTFSSLLASMVSPSSDVPHTSLGIFSHSPLLVPPSLWHGLVLESIKLLALWLDDDIPPPGI